MKVMDIGKCEKCLWKVDVGGKYVYPFSKCIMKIIVKKIITIRGL